MTPALLTSTCSGRPDASQRRANSCTEASDATSSSSTCKCGQIWLIQRQALQKLRFSAIEHKDLLLIRRLWFFGKRINANLMAWKASTSYSAAKKIEWDDAIFVVDGRHR